MKRILLILTLLIGVLLAAAVPAFATTQGMVTGCRWYTVNLRSGPGTGYAKVSELYQGYVLDILGRKGSWYKVEIVDPPEGITGWIHRKFVALQ
ncbi:MAG: SH3 domain-containing protein [Candidatus Margulisbacteria bacterium]|nr:SH3 domain-containing protein [Candidatus Margulisiibacteriota bacterium]